MIAPLDMTKVGAVGLLRGAVSRTTLSLFNRLRKFWGAVKEPLWQGFRHPVKTPPKTMDFLRVGMQRAGKNRAARALVGSQAAATMVGPAAYGYGAYKGLQGVFQPPARGPAQPVANILSAKLRMPEGMFR